MDLTSRVLVVFGVAAGAMLAVVNAAAVLMLAGADTHAIASQLLIGVAGAGGAVVGARANLASGRTLVAELAADRAGSA
jgi:hypothetical protein